MKLNKAKITKQMVATLSEATRTLQKACAAPAVLTDSGIQRALQKLVSNGAKSLQGLHRRQRPQASQFAKAEPKPESDDVPATALGRFIHASHANRFGRLRYRLYIPTSYHGQSLPLVVMLHGCTQNSDDFAAGTQMNEIAEEKGVFVLYPTQTKLANASNCWNWFNQRDQRREEGEPSIIAGMTRETIATYHIDPRSVYIAGLSSGGAMAMILAVTYPELYAAAGIHSGLPYGSAKDISTALAAMSGGASTWTPCKQRIPVIVFHGDQDTTVHPRNGHKIVEQSLASNLGPIIKECATHQGNGPGDHTYSRALYRDPGGRTVAEYWVIHGAGHAWSGGSKQGTHTDPKGPNASREMLRFFLAQTPSEYKAPVVV